MDLPWPGIRSDDADAQVEPPSASDGVRFSGAAPQQAIWPRRAELRASSAWAYRRRAGLAFAVAFGPDREEAADMPKAATFHGAIEYSGG